MLSLVVALEQISCDLLLDKAIQRFVGVERFDHIIAVPPRLTDEHIALDIRKVCIARQVQPMPTPVVTIGWGVEQSIHDRFMGSLRGVLQEVIEFGWGR